MKKHQASRAQLRLWALLTLAFSIVGFSAVFGVVKLSLDQYENDYRKELRGLVSLAALSVEAEAHRQLREPKQENSALYAREVGKLARLKGRLEGIRYIYTFTKTENGYVFVLDPTPPGDHDGDGIDDKSYIGDPYPEIPAKAKICYQQGIIAVDDEPSTDRWGTFVSAYAPIFGNDGKVVGVLGIDKLANDIAAYRLGLLKSVAGAFVIVIAMGIFFGWAFTRKLMADNTDRGWLHHLIGSKRISRATLLEIALGALALIVFVGALQTLAAQGRAVSSLSQSFQASKELAAINSEIEDEISVHDANIEDLLETARTQNIAWLYQRLHDLKDEPDTAKKLSGVRSISAEIGTRLTLEEANQKTLLSSVKSYDLGLISTFFLSAFLALATLIVIHTAKVQQQDLIAAQTDIEWHQVAYRQVVESFPEGLYMYSKGAIHFSNETWDHQCGRIGNEDRLSALTRGMPEEDRRHFLETIETAYLAQAPFEAQYPLITGSGRTINFETKGVPLFNREGEFECLLGFTVDVSKRIGVQEMLQSKNREVLLKNRMLSEAISDLEDNFDAMINALVKAVEAKDIYTAGHSERVMRYSMLIGTAMNLSQGQLKTLQMGTLIHDIGKIGIPDSILTKPGALTEEEYRIVKTHAENGARMVENIPSFQECVPIVRWHHERLDGSGYPDGLRGGELSLLVRIAAVADVFDALTSSRSYRSAMNVPEAVSLLRSMSEAGELDPELVEILAEIVVKDGALWVAEVDHAA